MGAADDERAAPLLAPALTLIAERGWRGFTAVELAARTGRPLPEIYDTLPSAPSVLALLGRQLDRAMLTGEVDELRGLTPRERLFELFMRRFDALAPYREGLVRIARDRVGDTAMLAVGCCNLDRMAAWMLEAAELRRCAPRDRLARRALTLAYMRVFRVWVRDESSDRAQTLAELDKVLAQADRLAGFAGRFQRRRRGGSGTAETAAA